MDKEFVKKNEKYFKWLYSMRRAGLFNMYEAPSRMTDAFDDVDEGTALQIFDVYCEYFEEVAEFLGIES